MIGYGAAKECSDDRKAIDIFQNFYEVEAVVKIMVSDREDTLNSSFGVGHKVKGQLRNNAELVHYKITKQLNFIKTHYVDPSNLYVEKVSIDEENYVYKKLQVNIDAITLVEVPFEKRADGDWFVSENWSGKILEIPTYQKSEDDYRLTIKKSNQLYPTEISYDDNDYDRKFPEIKI